jgi:hypothetical protein
MSYTVQRIQKNMKVDKVFKIRANIALFYLRLAKNWYVYIF